MKKTGRYECRIVRKDTDIYYTAIDTEYPLIKHPLFRTKGEAQAYIAGQYGLTWEEYQKVRRKRR